MIQTPKITRSNSFTNLSISTSPNCDATNLNKNDSFSNSNSMHNLSQESCNSKTTQESSKSKKERRIKRKNSKFDRQHDQILLLYDSDTKISNLIKKEILKNIVPIVPNSCRLLIDPDYTNLSRIVSCDKISLDSVLSKQSIATTNSVGSCSDKENILPGHHHHHQGLDPKIPVPSGILGLPRNLVSGLSKTPNNEEDRQENRESRDERGRSRNRSSSRFRIKIDLKKRARSATRVLGNKKESSNPSKIIRADNLSNQSSQYNNNNQSLITTPGLIFGKPINVHTVSITNQLCTYISCHCKTEGLFRLIGNKKRQKILKQSIEKEGKSCELLISKVLSEIKDPEELKNIEEDPTITLQNNSFGGTGTDESVKIYVPNDEKIGCFFQVHDACNLLKEMLRSIPNGILFSQISHDNNQQQEKTDQRINKEVFLSIIKEEVENSDPTSNDFSILLISSLFSLLGTKNRQILKSLLKLCYKIDKFSEHSKMDKNNLAIILFPILFPFGLLGYNFTNNNANSSNLPKSSSTSKMQLNNFNLSGVKQMKSDLRSSISSSGRGTLSQQNSQSASSESFLSHQIQNQNQSNNFSDNATIRSIDSILSISKPNDKELNYISFLIENHEEIFVIPNFLMKVVKKCRVLKTQCLARGARLDQDSTLSLRSNTQSTRESESWDSAQKHVNAIHSSGLPKVCMTPSDSCAINNNKNCVDEPDNINFNYKKIPENSSKSSKLPPITPKLVKKRLKKNKQKERDRHIDKLELSKERVSTPGSVKKPIVVGANHELPPHPITPKAAKLLGLGLEKRKNLFLLPFYFS